MQDMVALTHQALFFDNNFCPGRISLAGQQAHFPRKKDQHNAYTEASCHCRRHRGRRECRRRQPVAESSAVFRRVEPHERPFLRHRHPDLCKTADDVDTFYALSAGAPITGGALSTTAIAVTNGVISITVQLVRQSPLGFISGVLHIYGTDDLADDFSLISEEIVGISEGDSTFASAPAEGAVTQSVTASFSPTDVTDKFFRAIIEFPIPGDSDPGEEPEPDPEPDPEE